MATPRIINIPEEHRKCFVLLCNMDDETSQELISAIKRTSPVLSLHSFLRKISSIVSKISEDDVSIIMHTLISLHSLMLRPKFTVLKVADNICQSLQEDEPSWTSFSEETQTKFKKRLQDLLGIESLQLAAKAMDVLREHENIFNKARVLSDIRPVFGEQVETAPMGAVIIQTLKISYYQDSEIKDFFVAMDEIDLDFLIETLNRAKLKRVGLEKLIDRATIPHIKSE